MFDPLNNATHNPFAQTSPTVPSWPTTPHSPLSQAILPKPASPRPQTPDKTLHLPPGANPYGREPQIYGQPTPGLISPRTNTATNGTKFERNEPYLRVRITGLDRNRRDILVRLDAQVCTVFIFNYTTMLTCSLRLICPTLLERRTAMSRDHMPNSSGLRSRSHTVTPKPSYLLSHWLKHRRQRMKKVGAMFASSCRELNYPLFLR